MEKQNIKTIFLLQILFICVVFSFIFIPHHVWRKLFHGNNFAAAFTSQTGGDWNNPSTWGVGIEPFLYPQGIALSPTGEIYVADTDHSRSVVLNHDGTASTTFTPSGYGITFSPHGYIYLSNTNNSQINVIYPNLTASTSFFEPSGLKPMDLAFDTNNTIWVADTFNSRVVQLDIGGNVLQVITILASTSPDTFSFPTSIAISSTTGYIYVDDNGNHRIIVLNPDGTASTTYTGIGLDNSRGIAFSPNEDALYIANRNTNSIIVLDRYGNASTTFDGGVFPFNSPHDLAVAPNGDLYVLDTINQRVVVLDSHGVALTSYDGTATGLNSVEGVDYPGLSDDVDITNSVTLTADQSVHNVVIDGGTIDLNGHTLHVYGDWNNINGTIQDGTNSTGVVDFAGTSSQRIFGENTFQNLTKYSSASSSLLFDTSATTTILNNVHFSGTVNNLLSISPVTGSVIPVFDFSIGSSTPSISVAFSAPSSLTYGPNGYIYVTDYNSSRLVVLNPDGSASTTVDLSNYVVSSSPSGISISIANKIYISDESLNSIIVLNLDGTLDTIYGQSTQYNGIALDTPSDIKVASSGDLYITDYNNARIVVLHSNGNFFAAYDVGGNPTGLALSTTTGNIYVANLSSNQITVLDSSGNIINNISSVYLTSVAGIAISPSDELYISDPSNNSVVAMDTDGTVHAVYGTGLNLSGPDGIAVSPSGGIAISDSNNNRILVLDSLGNPIKAYYSAITDEFSSPFGVAHDSDDNIFISDCDLNTIQKFNASGTFLKQLDSDVLLSCSSFLTVDSVNNLYAISNNNNLLIRFDSSGNYSTSTTIEGIGTGIAVDNSGNIYLGSFDIFGDFSNNHGIIKLDPNFHILATTTEANNVSFSLNYDGITIDPTQQYMYVADDNNNRIVKLHTSDLSFVSETTGPVGVQFAGPSNVSIDATGDLYVSDGYNNRVVKMDTDYHFLNQWGTYGTEDGQFDFPAQMTIDTAGAIYVADLNNHRVQKFTQSPFAVFNIFLDSLGTSSFSYLSVSGSNNTSLSPFTCIDCIDAGANTNWLFATSTPAPTTPHHHRNNVSVGNPAPIVPIIPPSPIPSASTTASTTHEQSSSSTAEISPSPEQKEIADMTPTNPAKENPQEADSKLPQVKQPNTEKQKTTKIVPSFVDETFSSSFFDSVKSSFATTKDIMVQSFHDLKGVIESPSGSVITKSIATGGVALSAAISIGTVAFANPITFSEVWMVPARIFGLMLGALGIRRKQRQWGTVYDSVTKRPLDPAYVSLIDANGKEISSAITDLDGRYGFLVIPGTYRIVAKKTNYSFPSNTMQGKNFDEVYNDLYFGGDILIVHEGDTLTKNIPMDPVSFNWNEFAKNRSNINTFIKAKDVLWAKISKDVFIIGALVSFCALVFAPQPYNIIIAGFYIVAYIFNYVVFKQKKSGQIMGENGIPLAYSIVKIFREGETEPMLKKITDAFGKYYVLVPNGNYRLEIDRKNSDASYSNIIHSDIFTIDTGIINTDYMI